jgi:hypothetical protein
VEFTANRPVKAKLEQAMELMGPGSDKDKMVAAIEQGLDLFIAKKMKERFGVGRTPKSTVAEAEEREVVTRPVPVAIRREVHARDGGQCAYVSADGRRCEERSGLEFEHVDGFARTGRHSVEGVKLFCRPHNQHAADKLYGREFMEAKRRGIRTRTGTGTGTQEALL